MYGLLLKLLEDRTGEPGCWFWKLFEPIRQDLDRLFWCFPNQPWMAAPGEFQEDDSAAAPFEGEGRTGVMLWRPGSLGRYADRFMEEFIELWGVEPTADDPHQIAAEYSAAAWRDMEAVARRYARVWLIYTDSTCWEIYARRARLLDLTRAHLWGKPWVETYESHADCRAEAFTAAGLSEVWTALNGGHAAPAVQAIAIESAEVEAALSLSRFQVRLASGERLLAFLSRRLVGRGRPPRITPGSTVTVERSPYDPGACRIIEIGEQPPPS